MCSEPSVCAWNGSRAALSRWLTSAVHLSRRPGLGRRLSSHELQSQSKMMTRWAASPSFAATRDSRPRFGIEPQTRRRAEMPQLPLCLSENINNGALIIHPTYPQGTAMAPPRCAPSRNRPPSARPAGTREHYRRHHRSQIITRSRPTKPPPSVPPPPPPSSSYLNQPRIPRISPFLPLRPGMSFLKRFFTTASPISMEQTKHKVQGMIDQSKVGTFTALDWARSHIYFLMRRVWLPWRLGS